MNPINLYKSIFLEISAITALLLSRTFPTVFAFFFMHGLASFLISQIILALMPAGYRKKYALNLFFMTLFNTATLFLGYAASFYLVTVLLRKQKARPHYDTETLSYANLLLFPKIKRQLGEGAAALTGRDIPKDTKLKIMAAFAREITPEAIRVIKNFMSDDDSEIRLYSFQTINRLKNDINVQIDDALNTLEKESDSFKKAQINKKLALFYSHMFNLELSEESLRNFFMNKSMHYLSQAEEFMGDAELLFLRAQIMSLQSDYDGALEYFEKSVKYGLDGHTVYPLMAEIYFSRGEYNKVREILSKDFSLKLDFHTRPLAEVWEYYHA